MMIKRLFQNLNFLFNVSVIATKRFFNDKYAYRVSALTFTTLLALVPLFSVIVFFITRFPFFSSLITLSEHYIVENFMPDAATKLEVYFQNFVDQALHLPTISIIFLIITSIMLVDTIDDTINDIWQVPVKRRKFLALVFHFIILLLMPLLIGESVFFMTYFFSIFHFKEYTPFLMFFLPVLTNTIIFSFLYIISPNAKVKWRAGIAGGFIAAVLFETGKILFALYVAQYSTYALIYGTFAILPIFLLWLYICWLILLWGALVTHTINQY